MMGGVVLVLVLALSTAGAADAAVLCASRKGAVKLRETCKGIVASVRAG